MYNIAHKTKNSMSCLVPLIRTLTEMECLFFFNLTKLLGLGGAEGDRTPDLMAASHALSQLSYSPTRVGRCIIETAWCVNKKMKFFRFKLHPNVLIIFGVDRTPVTNH